MYGNDHKYFLLLLLTLVSYCYCSAQDRITDAGSKRNKSFVLTTGGGISQYTSSINQPVGQPINITRAAPAATIRVMWFPQYRLRVGLESGLANFYSYNLKNGDNYGKLRLTAIPVLVTWSMAVIKRLNVYAGFGSYFLTTRLNYSGRVRSRSVSLGSNFALAYQQRVSKKIHVAAEAKWMNAFVTKNNTISLQLQLAWKFLEY